MPLGSYVPDPDNASQPTDYVSGGFAARELRALKEKVNAIQSSSRPPTTAGTGSALTVSSLPAVLSTDNIYTLIVHADVLAGATLTPGAGSALPIFQKDGVTAVVAGQIKAGSVVEFRKSTTGLVLLNVADPYPVVANPGWGAGIIVHDIGPLASIVMPAAGGATFIARNLYTTDFTDWRYRSDSHGSLWRLGNQGFQLKRAPVGITGAVAVLTDMLIADTTTADGAVWVPDLAVDHLSDTFPLDVAMNSNAYTNADLVTPVEGKLYRVAPDKTSVSPPAGGYTAPTLNGVVIKCYYATPGYSYPGGTPQDVLGGMLLAGKSYRAEYRVISGIPTWCFLRPEDGWAVTEMWHGGASSARNLFAVTTVAAAPATAGGPLGTCFDMAIPTWLQNVLASGTTSVEELRVTGSFGNGTTGFSTPDCNINMAMQLVTLGAYSPAVRMRFADVFNGTAYYTLASGQTARIKWRL